MKFSMEDLLFNILNEKWSNKYKKSINCNNPKGFSQKAHCAARKKRKKGLKTKSKSPFNESILSEASKVDVLKNKLGLSDDAANKIDRICGPLSVWLTNKIKDLVKANLKSWDYEQTPENINKYTNKSIEQGQFLSSLTSIMDYIRVGLNGNISNLKSYNFNDIYRMSVDWHESLQTGQGDINYVEENEIIKDFRNEDGEGFYWVDLATNDSDEECKRMGHCGRTARSNNLYSLREVKKIPGGKYTLNKSHLTASIGDDDGTLYQLKGPKNSKPKDEFHQYILPLFYVLGGGSEEDEYLIQGFGSEYDSSRDFKLSDLPESTIKDLYSNRPELFESRSLKRLLDKMGIVELPKVDMTFNLELSPNRVSDFVDGDFVLSQRKTKDGRVIKNYLFETILMGETWDLWENYGVDWKDSLDYLVDSKNLMEISKIVRDLATKNGLEFDEELSLEEQIKEYDENGEIISALVSSTSDAESSAYADHLYETLKDSLEELGTVLQMDDTGVTLQIDLSNFISDIDDNYLDELFEMCNDDVDCVFQELIHDGDIDKPSFYVDDRYYPDVDEATFNQYLSDRLSEI